MVLWWSIAQTVGLPSAPPYLQPNSSFIAGVNFASAGSGLLNETNFGSVSINLILSPCVSSECHQFCTPILWKVIDVLKVMTKRLTDSVALAVRVQVVSMSEQVDQFKTVRVLLQNKLSAWGALKLISKSIFLVLSGSNDIVEYLSDPDFQSQSNATQFLSTVVEAYQTTLTVSIPNYLSNDASPIQCLSCSYFS